MLNTFVACGWVQCITTFSSRQSCICRQLHVSGYMMANQPIKRRKNLELNDNCVCGLIQRNKERRKQKDKEKETEMKKDGKENRQVGVSSEIIHSGWVG